jgi:C4-dicarboxylate-specific signal transduction histidine kinase
MRITAKAFDHLGRLLLIDDIEDHLCQVFVNLFLNAFDALPDTGGELMVNAVCENGNAVIRVQDNGCGIPPEGLKKIYEPFFSTKEVGKGSGLGLHVSLSIVHNHFGSIEAKSDSQRGTCFTVTLPIVQKLQGETNE